VIVAVANIYRAFTWHFIGLEGWLFIKPIILYVPIPFTEIVTGLSHNITSN